MDKVRETRTLLKGDAIAQQRLGTMLFYGIVIALAYFVYRVFEPFLVPLAWAVVLVVVAHPVFDRLERRMGATRAALVSTLGVTLVLIVPALGAMYAFAQQGIGAVHALQQGEVNSHFEWAYREWSHLQARFPSLSLDNLPETLRQYAEAAAAFVAARVGTILAHLAIFFFDLFVVILVMFYLFRDSKMMMNRLRDILPFERAQSEAMLRETEDLIFASVISTAAGAFAQGLLGAVSFTLAGMGAPIFWGVMVAFFSLVPVVGSAAIWVPASIVLMAQGHVTRGIALLAAYVVVIVAVDYVIRPWLISGRAEMGGLVVFISVFGGIAAFGMLGIVLGPIVVALAASLLDLYAPGPHGGNKTPKAHGKTAEAVLE